MTAVNLNRAIRGPVTAVPIVAGKGVRLVSDTENNRWLVEADETDLISTSVECTAGATFQLSESIANFERVKIYCARNPSANSNVCNEVLVGSAYYYIQASFIDSSSLLIDTAQLTISGTTVTVNAIARKTLAATTLTTSTNAPMTIIKIVGVNRIASN